VEIDPVVGESLADPRRVCVNDLAQEQFGSDGDDFGVHVIWQFFFEFGVGFRLARDAKA
jgi:hypothetical protein